MMKLKSPIGSGDAAISLNESIQLHCGKMRANLCQFIDGNTVRLSAATFSLFMAPTRAFDISVFSQGI